MDVIYLVQQLYLYMKKHRPTERKGLPQGLTMSVWVLEWVVELCLPALTHRAEDSPTPPVFCLSSPRTICVCGSKLGRSRKLVIEIVHPSWLRHDCSECVTSNLGKEFYWRMVSSDKSIKSTQKKSNPKFVSNLTNQSKVTHLLKDNMLTFLVWKSRGAHSILATPSPRARR